ncbi:hypothetical protein PIB30_092650 [Stylosanthes scabra]|uniref:Uncharacterized protein n=1 Tax=Stylosanthes scabra TaxID=79078 RepID=A0ABU6XSK2_9FABA|nr:hypothetical protein [Stylosanthes scabra]
MRFFDSPSIPMHQTVLKSEPPCSANRRPKLLHSLLSFMSRVIFFQFSGNFFDVYFRYHLHQNVLLSITVPTQQTAPQSDVGRAVTRHHKSVTPFWVFFSKSDQNRPI